MDVTVSSGMEDWLKGLVPPAQWPTLDRAAALGWLYTQAVVIQAKLWAIEDELRASTDEYYAGGYADTEHPDPPIELEAGYNPQWCALTAELKAINVAAGALAITLDKLPVFGEVVRHVPGSVDLTAHSDTIWRVR